ncbi:PE-PGRS family protein PE_PGRS26, partial [Aplysia californica]|uniref:PE-PGRS family protein PE_PGRS26 n=1 Tax=Aplysia californica TaxID=6500 RepID=A0ABM1A2E3_APLCA
MLNKTECDRVCSSIFEPVCQLITSALCHFSTWKGCIRPVSSTGAPAATSPTEGPHTEPGSTVVASESPAKTQEPTQAAGDTGGAGKAGTNGASGNTGTNGAADITDKPGQGVTKRPEVGKPSQRVTASPGQTAASTKSLNGAGGVTPALSGMTEKVDGQTLGPGQSTPEKMSGAEPTVPTRTSAGTPVLGGGAGGTGGAAGGDGGKIETPIPAVATEKPEEVEIPGAKATGQGEGGGQQTAGTSTEGTTKDAGDGDGSPGEDNTPQAGAGDKAGDDKKVGGLPEVVAGGDGDHVKVVGAGGDGGAEEIA